MTPRAALSRSPSVFFVPALYGFAFLSGAAALVYEVTWAQILALTFGRTTLAASAVLGGFMAGMGLGAWLYHRLEWTRLDAIRLYAALELGIVVTTASFTPAFAALPPFFAAVAPGIPAPAADLFRILFVLLILALPAALMGATYPALCAILIRSREGVARHLGPIYGLNTVGAAVGAMAAGFLLIEHLGLRDSVWFANGINLAVAAAAWSLGRRWRPEPPLDRTLEDAEAAIPTALPMWVTGTVLFGSGLATLAYEIVWFRALRYLFGNNTYALTTMLVVFLLGLGLGGLLCGRNRQRRFPERSLALSQLGIAVLAMGAITIEAVVLGDNWLRSLASIFGGRLADLPWWQRLIIDLGLAVAMMLPATLLMGFSFPLSSRLFLGDVRRLGQRVGSAYLLANLGSIVGSIVAALLLLPRLGTVGGTRAIAALNLLLGLLVLARLPWALPLRLAWSVGAAAAVLASFLFLPGRLPFAPVAIPGEKAELLFEEEGDLATVQVWASRKHPEKRAITVNGTSIGETKGVRAPIYAKQILLAHLPMVVDPEVERSLNIGLGSASTLHALASYSRVETLDVVEISSGVVRGSSYFDESSVLSDPRTQLHVEDVAYFLLRTPERYDLIISDGKLGRDFSGNSLMLSRDFYVHASHRLADDGVLVQWLPLGLPPAVFRTIVRTFVASFPETEIFFEDPGAIFLMGSRSPIPGRRAEVLSPAAQHDLRDLMIPDVEALLARWVASGAHMRPVLGDGPVLTWDRSTIEYSLYRSTNRDIALGRVANLALLLRAYELADGNPFLPAGSPYVVSTDLIRRSRLHFYRRQIDPAMRLAARALSVHPTNPQAVSVLEQYRSAAVRWRHRP